jgi:hypothetical protein
MENKNQELVDLYETLRAKDDIFKRFNIAGTPPHHLENPKFQKYFIGMALVCEEALGKFPKSKEQILTYCKKAGSVDRRNWDMELVAERRRKWSGCTRKRSSHQMCPGRVIISSPQTNAQSVISTTQ